MDREVVALDFSLEKFRDTGEIIYKLSDNAPHIAFTSFTPAVKEMVQPCS